MTLTHIVLLASLLVLALQAQEITVPSLYSVVVSKNSDDIGFTFAYKEYYNADTHMWRTDGNGTMNIFNLTSNLFSVVSKTSPCTSYAMQNSTRWQPSIMNIYPSNFTELPGTVTDEARSIPANRYVINENNVNISGIEMLLNITTTYYFAIDTGLPVRIIENYSNATNETVYEIYTDWVNWIVNITDPTTFDVPSNCPLSNETSPFFGNFTSTVDHDLLPDNATFPTLSSSFYAVVEGKVPFYLGLTELIGANWYYDAHKNMEHIDLEIDASSPFTGTEIYDYNTNTTYTTLYTNGYCQPMLFETQPSRVSLLSSKGVGTIHQLFIPLPNSSLQGLDTSKAVYTGHTLVRGVLADTWVISNVSATDEDGVVTATFSTSVYFFPKGWQFFGRNVSGSVPMRVVNSGNNTDGTPYFGQWDIFLYSNDEQDASAFDVTSIGCSVISPTKVNVTIPPQYSVFVSFSDILSGATYAYEEFGDSINNISRVFMYNGDQIIVDINENSVYAFYPYNLSQQCQVFEFINSTDPSDSSYFDPVFLTMSEITELNYVGRTDADVVRGIITDHYNYIFNSPLSGFEFNVYIDVFTGYLVRLSLKETDENQVTVNHKVLEYVDWTAAKPNATVFTKPTQCLNETWVYSTANITYTPVNDTTLPQVATQFFMVLEGKNSATAGASLGITWYYDSVSGMERIETLDQTQGVLAVTFNHTDNSTYASQNGNCTKTNGTSMGNILMAGTGFIHAYFDSNSEHVTGFTQSAGVYAGQKTLREAVNATRFDYSNLVAHTAQGNYTFDASVYFFPKGWNFPLRNLTSDTRVPLRVAISGNFTPADGSIALPVSETWDLFEYHPSAPAASAFEPCVASLIPLPPPPFPTPAPTLAPTPLPTLAPTPLPTPLPTPEPTPAPTPEPTPEPTPAPTPAPPATTGTSTSITSAAGKGGRSLSSLAKAGIAIVIIVAVVGLLVGVFLTVRRRRNVATSQMSRENRTFEQMHDQDDF